MYLHTCRYIEIDMTTLMHTSQLTAALSLLYPASPAFGGLREQRAQSATMISPALLPQHDSAIDSYASVNAGHTSHSQRFNGFRMSPHETTPSRPHIDELCRQYVGRQIRATVTNDSGQNRPVSGRVIDVHVRQGQIFLSIPTRPNIPLSDATFIEDVQPTPVTEPQESNVAETRKIYGRKWIVITDESGQRIVQVFAVFERDGRVLLQCADVHDAIPVDKVVRLANEAEAKNARQLLEQAIIDRGTSRTKQHAIKASATPPRSVSVKKTFAKKTKPPCAEPPPLPPSTEEPAPTVSDLPTSKPMIPSSTHVQGIALPPAFYFDMLAMNVHCSLVHDLTIAPDTGRITIYASENGLIKSPKNSTLIAYLLDGKLYSPETVEEHEVSFDETNFCPPSRVCANNMIVLVHTNPEGEKQLVGIILKPQHIKPFKTFAQRRQLGTITINKTVFSIDGSGRLSHI